MSIAQAFVAGCAFVAMAYFGARFFWHFAKALAGKYGEDAPRSYVPLEGLFGNGGGALIAATVLQITLAVQPY